MLALAAALWLAYLLPVWFRRREYLATERNAVRLQQTLRIMAHSAELPQEVWIEADARAIAERQRALRIEAKRAEAAMRARSAAEARAAMRRLADSAPSLAAAVTDTRRAMRRLRRTRAVTTLVLLAAAVTAGVQLGMMATLGVASGAWLVLAVCGFVGVSSIALLGRLAGVSRARRAAARSTAPLPVSEVVRPSSPAPPVERAERTWTPVPLPKPLYLGRAVMPPPVMADPSESVRVPAVAATARVPRPAPVAAPAAPGREDVPAAASVPAAGALAAASAAAGATGPARREHEPAPVVELSRWAAMGRVSVPGGSTPDIDAVLRRRRTAG